MSVLIPSPVDFGFTTTTSAPLYWCSYGEASRSPLLVLHGGPGAHHDYLLPQFLELARQHRLVFYDQRGGGRSRLDPNALLGWKEHATDLAEVARELVVGGLTLVGYSWGALLALLYSLEAPISGWPTPKRLVLIDPAPLWRGARVEFEAEFSRRLRGQPIAGMRAELSASGLRERDPDGYRQRAFELSVAPYFANPGMARDLTPFRVTGRVQQAVWESLGDFDVIPRLQGLKVPTLIVHGRRDPIPLESSESAARAMEARFLVLEASGHVPYVEQPAALFSAITQFLEDTA